MWLKLDNPKILVSYFRDRGFLNLVPKVKSSENSGVHINWYIVLTLIEFLAFTFR